MMLEAMGLSLLLGLLRKGRISNLQYLPFRGSWLLILSFAVQTVAFTKTEGNLFYWVHMLSYGILLIGILINFRIPAMLPIFIGTLLNGLVIAFNNGRMPVKLPAGIVQNFDHGHALLTSSTKLWFLSDIFIINRPYPWPKVLSIGDFFLIAGTFWFVQYWLMYHKTHNISEISTAVNR